VLRAHVVLRLLRCLSVNDLDSCTYMADSIEDSSSDKHMYVIRVCVFTAFLHMLLADLQHIKCSLLYKLLLAAASCSTCQAAHIEPSQTFLHDTFVNR